MKSKICTKCKVLKSFNLFLKDKRASDKLQSQCKSCQNEQKLKFHHSNKHNPEYVENRRLARKLYKSSEKGYVSYEKWKKSEKKKSSHKRYANSEKGKLGHSVANKKYRKSEKGILTRRINERNRNHLNLQSRLKRNLRTRLFHVLRGDAKAGSAVRDLGCSAEFLKLHIESQFQPGMTWENYGLKGWHIDHIIPLASFDLTNREQFLKACHYTNLQPLWASDNIKKSDSIPESKESVG